MQWNFLLEAGKLSFSSNCLAKKMFNYLIDPQHGELQKNVSQLNSKTDENEL